MWWCNGAGKQIMTEIELEISSVQPLNINVPFTQHITGIYRQISNISCTLVGNKIVDHSDVVGASTVVLLQLHLHSRLNTWLQYIAQRQLQDETRNI